MSTTRRSATIAARYSAQSGCSPASPGRGRPAPPRCVVRVRRGRGQLGEALADGPRGQVRCDDLVARPRVAAQVAGLGPGVGHGDPDGAAVGVPHVDDDRRLRAPVALERDQAAAAQLREEGEKSGVERHGALPVRGRGPRPGRPGPPGTAYRGAGRPRAVAAGGAGGRRYHASTCGNRCQEAGRVAVGVCHACGGAAGVRRRRVVHMRGPVAASPRRDLWRAQCPRARAWSPMTAYVARSRSSHVPASPPGCSPAARRPRCCCGRLRRGARRAAAVVRGSAWPWLWGGTGAGWAVGVRAGPAGCRVLLGLGWLGVAAGAGRRAPPAAAGRADPAGAAGRCCCSLAPVGGCAVVARAWPGPRWRCGATSRVHLRRPAALGAGDVKLAGAARRRARRGSWPGAGARRRWPRRWRRPVHGGGAGRAWSRGRRRCRTARDAGGGLPRGGRSRGRGWRAGRRRSARGPGGG